MLAGISTSGVVLSTLLEAADLDFRLTVLADACADSDSGFHDALINSLMPRKASVMTVDDWITSIDNR